MKKRILAMILSLAMIGTGLPVYGSEFGIGEEDFAVPDQEYPPDTEEFLFEEETDFEPGEAEADDRKKDTSDAEDRGFQEEQEPPQEEPLDPETMFSGEEETLFFSK